MGVIWIRQVGICLERQWGKGIGEWYTICLVFTLLNFGFFLLK